MDVTRALLAALLLAPVIAGCVGGGPEPSEAPILMVATRTDGEPGALELDPRILVGTPGVARLKALLDEAQQGFETSSFKQVTPKERREAEDFLDARWREAQWDREGEAPPRPDPLPVRYQGVDLRLSFS